LHALQETPSTEVELRRILLESGALQLVSADVSFLARIFSFKLSASRLAAAIRSWMSFAADADACCDIFEKLKRGDENERWCGVSNVEDEKGQMKVGNKEICGKIPVVGCNALLMESPRFAGPTCVSFPVLSSLYVRSTSRRTPLYFFRNSYS